MGSADRCLSNIFAPVLHTELRLPTNRQPCVDVIYSNESSEFVLSQLKKELEKRSVTCMLPQDESKEIQLQGLRAPSKFCGLLLVVSGRYSVPGDTLHQAVTEAQRKVSLTCPAAKVPTVLVQTVGTCPDWVVDTCTPMMYPQEGPGKQTVFWDTLSSLIANTTKAYTEDLNQPAISLFGPIGQAVLENPDQQEEAISILYDHSTEHFVYTELAQEVEKRSRLRMVLELEVKSESCERLRILPTREFCQHALVMLGRAAVRHVSMLKTVFDDRSKHGDSYIFVLFDNVSTENVPLWLQTKIKSSPWFRYSDPASKSYADFWDILVSLIEARIKVSPVRRENGEQLAGGAVTTREPTEFAPIELSDEGSTQSGDDDDDSSYVLEELSDEDGAQIERDDSGSDDPLSGFTPLDITSNPPCVQNIQSGRLVPQRSGLDCMVSPLGQTTASTNDAGETTPWPEAVKTDNQDQVLPIFSRQWQASLSFSCAGGTSRKPDSDVTLSVPSGAIDQELQVNIYTAVCTDVDRVHRVLNLPEVECISSPLVEYWAGHDFRFKTPVRITLPHFLPPDPNPRLVHVYRVTRRPDGQLVTTRLRQGKQSPSAQEMAQTSSSSRHASMTPGLPSSEADDATPSSEDEVICEETSFWLFAADHLTIVTDHFSGYVCSYCGKDQGPPVLKAMACGSHHRKANGQWEVHISLHVWDRRLKILDFQQDFGVPSDQDIGKRSISLRAFPGQLQESKLHVRLELSEQDQWQFCLRENGRPSTPVSQNRTIDCFLSCDNDTCSVVLRERSCPVHYNWLLESKSCCKPDPSLQFLLDICHCPSEQAIPWEEEDNVTMETWPLRYPKPKDQREATSQTDDRGSPSVPPAPCHRTEHATGEDESCGLSTANSSHPSYHNTCVKEPVPLPPAPRPAPYLHNSPGAYSLSTQAPFLPPHSTAGHQGLYNGSGWPVQPPFPCPHNGWSPTQHGALSPGESPDSVSSMQGDSWMTQTVGPSGESQANGMADGSQNLPTGSLSSTSQLVPHMNGGADGTNGKEGLHGETRNIVRGAESLHSEAGSVQGGAGNIVPVSAAAVTLPGVTQCSINNNVFFYQPTYTQNNPIGIHKIQGSPNFGSTVTSNYNESSRNTDLDACSVGMACMQTPQEFHQNQMNTSDRSDAMAQMQASQGLHENYMNTPDRSNDEYSVGQLENAARNLALNLESGRHLSDTRNPVCSPSQ